MWVTEAHFFQRASLACSARRAGETLKIKFSSASSKYKDTCGVAVSHVIGLPFMPWPMGADGCYTLPIRWCTEDGDDGLCENGTRYQRSHMRGRGERKLLDRTV